MSGKYTKLLLFWVILFGIALAIIFISWQNASNASAGINLPGIADPGQGTGDDNAGALNLVLGVITALTSAGGFIVTTLFALREDRRDAAMHKFQIERLKREIEQKDLELDQMRREQENENDKG
jgi:hypothetical protein